MATSMHMCFVRRLSHRLRRIPIYQAAKTHVVRQTCTISGSRALWTYRPTQLGTVQAWRSSLGVSPVRCLSTEAATDGEKTEDEYHSIIKDTERAKGPSDEHEFQAETRQLLDIVARSLYSEKEVFIRELISNSSDALEKLRYLQLTGSEVVEPDTPLEIHIATNDEKKTLTIQDTGVGMTKEELIDNLGTIARSGSKAFVEQLTEKSDLGSSLIGQFGVGFYSSFMVGQKVDVYTCSHKPQSGGLKWTSDGTGKYEISEAEGVQRGTKIVIHLKGDCYDFSKEDLVTGVVQKYSNFVGVPIYLNGKRANILQVTSHNIPLQDFLSRTPQIIKRDRMGLTYMWAEALWMLDPKDVTEEMHEDFYRFIGNALDKPRYHFHYKTDAPINIRALFYVPEYKPTLFDMSRETDVNITLYSRKVMIMSKANNILPKWMRFMKGVVDSEDIPLNLSRELLQDSALIRKLRTVLTNRVLKFFLEQAKRDRESYMRFYEDYGLFFREGIVTTVEQDQREEISKLLRFESSKCDPGERMSLEEYVGRMKAGSRTIYYLSAPSRQLAETSPYFEAFRKRDIEVLFLYEPYDELVLMNLGQFDKKMLKSVENEIQEDASDTEKTDATDESSLDKDQLDTLMSWLQVVLTNKVNKVKVTRRLDTHPCVVTVVEMGSARHFLKTTMADKSQEERYRLLQPTLEINPSHTLVKKLNVLRTEDPDLAKMLAEQIYDNAMVNAGLVDDPRSVVNRLNELLVRVLDKH